ncbi:hypothetical protein MKW92_007736, partial [Papaver armeniacum]
MKKFFKKVLRLISTAAPKNYPSAPDSDPSAPNNDRSNSRTVKSNLRVFDLEEIKTATDNFSPRFIVNEDMPGKIYRGHDFTLSMFLDLEAIQGSEEEWL